MLRIVGTGSERMKIVEIAKYHPNICFYDTIDEKQKMALYSISDIFLLVSSREGSGIVVLEANASGLPVITLKFPNNSVAFEGIREGVNGMITDVQNIVDTILHVHDNLDRFRKSSIGYAKNYTWEKLVNKIENIYYKLSD